VKLSRLAAPASYVFFVIMVFAIPQNLGPVQWGNTYWAKAHITKLNKLTESEVSELTRSTVDETARAILKRPESRGITIVRLQRTFLFHIPIMPY
jgi:hypothetical protein